MRQSNATALLTLAVNGNFEASDASTVTDGIVTLTASASDYSEPTSGISRPYLKKLFPSDALAGQLVADNFAKERVRPYEALSHVHSATRPKQDWNPSQVKELEHHGHVDEPPAPLQRSRPKERTSPELQSESWPTAPPCQLDRSTSEQRCPKQLDASLGVPEDVQSRALRWLDTRPRPAARSRQG